MSSNARTPRLDFGLAFASSVGTDPQSALEIARLADSLGFESIWGGEHVVRPGRIESPYPYSEDVEMPGDAETPIPDPLIWLAYVAGFTSMVSFLWIAWLVGGYGPEIETVASPIPAPAGPIS